MKGKFAIVSIIVMLCSSFTFADFITSFEESEGYVLGSVAGQNGWSITLGSASRAGVTDWWKAHSDGNWGLYVNAYTGGGRASHSINQNSVFNVSVTMAWYDAKALYAVMDILGEDGIWNGIRCGFMLVGDAVKFMYRDGSVQKELPLEPGINDPARGIHYRFDVTVYPSTSSYDLSVYKLDNTLVGSVSNVSARHGTNSFTTVNFTIEGDADTKHTMYVDDLHVVPEPATIGLLGFGIIGIFRRK